METFDYLVVGAGSAGCVVAARLSEDADRRVLLLEAGERSEGWLVRTPAGWGVTVADPRFTWQYLSEPEPGTANRRHVLPRGRMLGGTSAINGMLYIRGQAEDYDAWAAAGATGWDWSNVLPWFRKSERQARGGDALHGADGPLPVGDVVERHPVSDAIAAAFRALGTPHTDDFNGPTQEGVGYVQTTILGGERWSTARAFLEPARHRPNLTIVTGALAERILFEQGRAAGVVYREDGQVRTAKVRREIVICAGALDSPRLLQRSGIGRGADLQALGIPVVADRPGVGANLQDHFLVPMMWRLKPGVPSLNERLQGMGVMVETMRYLARRRGVLTLPGADVVAFVRHDTEATRPDVQFHCLPVSGDLHAGHGTRKSAHRTPGFTVAPCMLRPRSRGHVSIGGPSVDDAPRIVLNYLQHEEDVHLTIGGMKIARRVAAQAPLAALVAEERMPGAKASDDAALLDFAIRHGQTTHHPVGTCRMGADSDAVVDSELRVRGVRNLRVADASVMPLLISGNTNAPSIMIGERAADFIRRAG